MQSLSAILSFLAPTATMVSISVSLWVSTVTPVLYLISLLLSSRTYFVIISLDTHNSPLKIARTPLGSSFMEVAIQIFSHTVQEDHPWLAGTFAYVRDMREVLTPPVHFAPVFCSKKEDINLFCSRCGPMIYINLPVNRAWVLSFEEALDFIDNLIKTYTRYLRCKHLVYSRKCLCLSRFWPWYIEVQDLHS